MEIPVINQSDNSQNTVTVADDVFGVKLNMALVHQVVTAQQAALRAGSKAQKNRSAVRGGGAKPWKQKGTGRARAGTSRSPIWRTGGVTFAASPRDFSCKVNRKMLRGSMCSILSELFRQERLIICNDFSLEEAKTKLMIEQLNQFSASGVSISDVLIIVDDINNNDKLLLASRNLHFVGLEEASQVNSLQLLQYEKILITEAALIKLQERLNK